MGSEGNQVADADTPQKKDKYGEPVTYDPSFKGPIKKRGCTDIICCLFFIICLLGMFVVGYFGYAYGDPVRLIYPSNSAGELCGYGELVGKPYLFFFDLLVCATSLTSSTFSGCPTPQVCVEKCPTEYWTWYQQHYAEEVASLAVSNAGAGLAETIAKDAYQKVLEMRSKMMCLETVDPKTSSKTVEQLIDDNECAPYYTDSSPLLYRCVPSIIVKAVNTTANLISNTNVSGVTFDLTNKYNEAITGDAIKNGTDALGKILNLANYGEKILQDIVASWWMMLVGLGISMVVAFIWIVVMRWIAGIMVWVTIAAFIGLFAFAIYYSYTTYYSLKNDPTANTEITITLSLDYWKNLTTTWLVLGCTTSTLLAIILLILIFLRERIMIAIALIKEASRAVSNMIFTLLWPVIPWIMQLILFAYCVAVAVFLASTTVTIRSSSNETLSNSSSPVGSLNNGQNTNFFALIPCNSTEANSTAQSVCNFVTQGTAAYTDYLQIYNLFMWFWVMNFIVAMGQMVLAGAFAAYYWAFNKPDDIPAFPLMGSLGRTLFYHTGSLAFGALIIAIIQIIRVILEYVDSKMKGSENQIAKFFLKCLKCCFWCLEKFMKMINKNAYILIAIYGKNFCTSAKNAFFLIMRNIVRVAVVDKVTDFILFIGKLVVVGAVGAAAFYFFKGDIPYLVNYTPTLNYWVLPVVIITIGAYVIASGFFSVYGMGVDTLFLCFLEDLERHDGSAEKPYYMNKELMGILGKKNVIQKKE